MEYEVVLTTQAKMDFRQIINYLSHVAGSLKKCEDDRLRALGYRTIHFKWHRYFMLYRIEGSVVYVDSIYHDLQDYENLFR